MSSAIVKFLSVRLSAKSEKANYCGIADDSISDTNFLKMKLLKKDVLLKPLSGKDFTFGITVEIDIAGFS
jgi:hypothetical protein